MEVHHAILSSVFLFTWVFPSTFHAQGQIAFQTNRDAQWEIYIMNEDGSAQTNLTNHSSRDIDPTWSPDGSKIAFASDRGGEFQIFVMSADGTRQTQLTEQPGHHIRPAWSPDGSQIAFASDQEGNYDIYVMQADGSDAVNVTQHPSLDTSPSWSPDGTQLAFTSQRDRLDLKPHANLDRVNFNRLLPEPSDIFVMDALGGAVTNLTSTSDATYNREPSWSPTGDRILFVYRLRLNAGSIDDLMTIDVSGGVPLRLNVPRINSPFDPSWSPDGTSFLFSSIPEGGVDVFAGIFPWDVYLSSAGGSPVNLTQSPYADEHAVWSPRVLEPVNDTGVEGATWGAIKVGLSAVDWMGYQPD